MKNVSYEGNKLGDALFKAATMKVHEKVKGMIRVM